MYFGRVRTGIPVSCFPRASVHGLVGRGEEAGRQEVLEPRQRIKSKDLTLSTKVRIVKVMVFSSSHVRMCEWTIKKPEH